MPSLQKNWITASLMAACAIAVPCSAVAGDMLTENTAQATTLQDWIAVDAALLDEMRGGFDLASGLKVSIGIERMVNLNGTLQTATRIEVPDAGSLLQAQRSAGATALIQNGLGNMVTTGVLSPEAAATVIQNNASNQTIQSVTVINAATNSLELLKGANLQSTLLDALTQTARSR